LEKIKKRPLTIDRSIFVYGCKGLEKLSALAPAAHRKV